jgi:hypothetical protein
MAAGHAGESQRDGVPHEGFVFGRVGHICLTLVRLIVS